MTGSHRQLSRHGRKRTRLLLSVALTAGTFGGAFAQQAAQQEGDRTGPVVLETVVITTASGRSGSGNATAMDGEALELRYPNATISEILTEIPGISTQVDGDDPGVSVNIRGMQDFGRVNVLVDGARQNFQRNSHGANGTFYTDTEMLKTVEVTRGPGATIYGSGAIGGVLNMTTIDASDIIADGAERGARLRFGLDSNGPGPTVNLVGATRLGTRADLLIGGTWFERRDHTSGGDVKVPSGQEMRSGLLKGTFRPADGHELSFSASRYRNDFVTGITTMRDTEVTVDTVTAGYRFTAPDNDLWDLNVKGYWTRTDMQQARPDGTPERAIGVTTTGLDAWNVSRLSAGGVDHELTFGFDVYRDRVTNEDPYQTGANLTAPGRRTVWGAHIQDRVRLSDWLEVTGALRYDSYKMDNGSHQVEGDRLSPKLTVGIKPNDTATFYVSYAEGFRGPALTEALIEGFHPGSVSGEFLPNPDLRPEIAHTIEAGVQLQYADLMMPGDDLNARFTVFQNDVDDYIDQAYVIHGLYGAMQYLNIARVRIRGVELETSYDSDRWFAGLNAQVMDGERRSNEDLSGILYFPDDSNLQPKIPPWRVVATAGFKAMDDRLQAGARLTLVGARDEAGDSFASDSYETVDLFAHYQIREGMSANIALNNIFDRDYTQYLNVRPSPGFNARAMFSVRF